MYNTPDKIQAYARNWYKDHPTYNAERNRRDRKKIRAEIIGNYIPNSPARRKNRSQQ